MFTGLIQDVGFVAQCETTPAGSRVTIAASSILEGAQLGDSIAIDGVCTTVVALGQTPGAIPTFTIEASPETLSKTHFKRLVPGVRVNLERPLTLSQPLGGHFVTGHVDGLATIVDRHEDGISWIYRFQLQDKALAPMLVPKGSIAVLGISLTVNTVEDDTFSVAIIPHTLAHTNLGDYGVGDGVNIETDLIGKYIVRMVQCGWMTNTNSTADAIHGVLASA